MTVVPLVQVGLEVVDLLLRIKTRDPKIRARALRARAENLREEADRLPSAIRAQELSAHNGTRQKFHNRQIRKLMRRQQRLGARAVWCSNRADWIDPPK